MAGNHSFPNTQMCVPSYHACCYSPEPMGCSELGSADDGNSTETGKGEEELEIRFVALF